MTVSPETFTGRIGRTLAESTPSFVEPPHPGQDAPNVVVVLLDDTGFAQFGCYGSDIDTPNIDQLAAGGLQFTNFHVTPLCSPTRASLLTGRSQHAVGMRSVSNFTTGFPHQLGHISPQASTLAEVLGAAGYATFCTGKWHLAPMEQCSAAGPFDHWPLGKGFNRFYGFLEGETDQFYPDLVADNHPIEPPAKPEDGYHVSEDIIDQALSMITDSKGVRPDRPFFAYVPFGATHAPHQAPEKYLAKYRGAFDEGWDVVRQRWFDKQKALGVISAETQLAPRNPGVEPWDELPETQQRLAARLQEAFAAFLDHTDDQIGRLVQGLDDLGQLDNTLLILLADNGASQEGGPFGVMHEMKFFNGILETPEEAIKDIETIGGPQSHTNYPWGWAQCGNSPFKWYKQNTHEGGVHVPMIVHWPQGVNESEQGTKRHQFVNVADIAPTIYEFLGIAPPETFNGVEQLPVTGHSFAPLLNAADHPAVNTLQYFEMAGSRALVAENWKAVCRHLPDADYDTEPWELYDLAVDASECNDLADAHPEKLEELKALWWDEAQRHGVLPLDDRGLTLFGPRFRDLSPHPTNRRYVYRPPMLPIPAQASAAIGGRSFDLTAQVDRQAGQEGVLWATGTENSGISFFLLDSQLVMEYNAFGQRTVVRGPGPVPEGNSTLVAQLRRTGARTGTMQLSIDGSPGALAELPLYMGVISSVGSSIGYDHGSAVSTQYQSPFAFAGTLQQIEIELRSRQSIEAARAQAQAEMSRQ